MLGVNDTVLVTGATGFTGNVLVTKLCQAGVKVKAIARASSDRGALADLPIEWLEGDVFEADVVASAVHDVNYIFHVAAAFREAKISDEVYYNVHVKSTQLLARAVVGRDGFKRFIHVSTVGVLGHIEHPPADEHTAYNPGDIYQQTKLEAEQWIIELSKNNDFPLTVVRPAAIYGPGDRRLLKIFKIAMLPVVPIIGFGKGLYHLIHVDDLADFMIFIADAEVAQGEVYICGNPEAIPIRDMITVIAGHLGVKPKCIQLPAWPFFAIGFLCELLCKPLGIEPPIYRRRVAFFTKDRSFRTDKMRKDTGFQYAFTNKSGLQMTADWYRDNGWL